MAERNYLKTEAVFLAEKTPKKEVVVTPPLREDSLKVTENGTYQAPIGRGYTDVEVNVPTPINKLPSVINRTITSINADDFGDITEIGQYVFYECSSLSSISIPEGITEILAHAFENCNLSSLILPSTITQIATRAFARNSLLNSITIYAPTPPTFISNAFLNIAESFKIYVPAESVEAYKSASGWSTYSSQIEAISE